MSFELDPFQPPPPDPGPDLKPVRVKPGQKPPQVDPTKDYILLTGSGPFRFSGYRGHAGAPIVICAEATLEGNTKGQACGLLLDDGCADLRVESVRAIRNGHGIRLRGCERVHLKGCESAENQIEGFILGAARCCTVEDCKSWRNGRGPAAMEMSLEVARDPWLPVGDSWTPDKRHGGYDSYGGEGNLWLRFQSWDNTGLGIHLTSPADEQVGPMKDITLRGCVLRGNGSGGSGNLDASNLRGLLVEDCLIASGNGGFSTWDDGSGDPGKGAKGVVLRRSTIYIPSDRFSIRLESGGIVSLESCIVAGRDPTQTGGSRLTQDAATKQGTVAEAAEWLDPVTLKSLLPGVGWQG